MRSSALMRAIFLDRDGVINRKAPENAYISNVGEFSFLPGSVEAIAQATGFGYKIFVVTNQRGVARGLVTLANLAEIHATMIKAIRLGGGEISQIYVCPHDYADHCACRKPNPGMLLRAQYDYGIDLQSSWMVGDSASDMEAGARMHCRTVFVGENTGQVRADIYASSLLDAVQKIHRIDKGEIILPKMGKREVS